MRKRCVIRWHCLHCLDRITLEKEEGIVESWHTLHYVAKHIIYETQSRNFVAFEVDREAQSHGTRLTWKILVAVTGQFGHLGISDLACLHIYGTKGVDRGRVFQFGRGRTVVEYVVEYDGLTGVSIAGLGAALNLH
jgi:hypothetical protein